MIRPHQNAEGLFPNHHKLLQLRKIRPAVFDSHYIGTAYKVILKKEGVIATAKMRRPMENLTLEQEKELLDALEGFTKATIPLFICSAKVVEALL